MRWDWSRVCHLKVLRDEGFGHGNARQAAVLYQLEPIIQSANGGRAIDLGCCHSFISILIRISI